MARSTSKSGPEWPTIEDQLRAAHVQPGSKLEELIRENQDFSLLRPEELDDGLRIPIWLRLHSESVTQTRHPSQATRPAAIRLHFEISMSG